MKSVTLPSSIRSALLAALLALLHIPTAAAAAETAKGKTIVATANGMVCAFCAQGIDAQFRDEPAVQRVQVNLTQRWVIIEEAADAVIDDQAIRRHITNAGFEVVSIQRLDRPFDDVLDSLRQR
jgi:mercuric ion binding protein